MVGMPNEVLKSINAARNKSMAGTRKGSNAMVGGGR